MLLLMFNVNVKTLCYYDHLIFYPEQEAMEYNNIFIDSVGILLNQSSGNSITIVIRIDTLTNIVPIYYYPAKVDTVIIPAMDMKDTVVVGIDYKDRLQSFRFIIKELKDKDLYPLSADSLFFFYRVWE